MNNHEICITTHKGNDGEIYYRARFAEFPSVVGRGKTKDEAIVEAQENLIFFMEFFGEEEN